MSGADTVVARDVSFAYPGHAPVLDSLDAGFCAGSTTAIVGPSGCGKSTLLYLLGLLLRPTSGRIELDGAPVGHGDRLRSQLRARKIGFVFQDSALDPTRTVIDNVCEGALYAGIDRAAARRRASELLEQFGVTAQSGRRAADVSGGQAQRIALCRAILVRPSLVLADEPTGNLDIANSDSVMSGLSEIAGLGTCVIVVTHDRRIAHRCDGRFELT